MKKMMLKIMCALPSPAAMGNVASMMGTAPRIPTHEMKTWSLTATLNGIRHKKIAIGLATKIRKNEIISPIPITGTICEGNTKSPKVINMIICINQAIPSKNCI